MGLILPFADGFIKIMVDGFSHRNVVCTREAFYVSKKYAYVDKVGGLEGNTV